MANLFNPSELYDLLASQGVLPQWARELPVGGERGQYIIDPNRIVAPDPTPKKGFIPSPQQRSTLAHELTHSVQFQVLFDAAANIQRKLRENKKVSQEELQFLENAQKMYIRSFGPINQGNFKKEQERSGNLDKAVAALYKNTGEGGKRSQYDRYRTSPVELQAFGVGNMTQGGRQKQYYDFLPAHLDPSFATEFSILTDQFKKLPQDVKTTSESSKKTIETSRKTPNKEHSQYLFEDILKDPFAPTIK